ncbi:hypothetical protein AAFC00_000567 [Neodothiora populina]|uniref:Uncharacterized protein n=1 Tax=Neodothiora populina TaxID=2781224 RepID=A0ABR3PDC7_9PEZI
MQSLRFYSSAARVGCPITVKDRVAFVATVAYICIAFSAPFAGAAEMSRRTRKDGTFAKMRPLSFRDCLPSYGSRLEDFGRI